MRELGPKPVLREGLMGGFMANLGSLREILNDMRLGAELYLFYYLICFVIV